MGIVTIGDNCIDLYSLEGKSYPGGNAVNVAVYLKRFGVNTSYVGVVGSDENGNRMIDSIRKRNVDVSHLHSMEGKTAVTYVELIGNDRKFVSYDEGVMANFTLTEDDILFIKKHDIVHSGISGHCNSYFQEFKKSGLITSFDFSDERDNILVNELPCFIDYPFFSYKEDDSFIRNFLMEIHKQGSKVAVATLGENGSIAYDGLNFYKTGIEKVQVEDTMGAGDSFIAGFLYGVSKMYPVEKCLTYGAQNAAKTITYYGAW